MILFQWQPDLIPHPFLAGFFTGVIAVDQGGSLSLLIQDSVEVSSNVAGVSGGMLYVGEGCSADLSVAGGAVIQSNTASTYGGVIQAQRPTAFTVSLGPNTVLRNNSGLYGGCISLVGVQSESVQINSQCKGNVGNSGGGVLALMASSNIAQVSIGSGAGCSVESNRAADGGVILMSETSRVANLTVDPGCRVASNAAQSSGGFLSVSGGSSLGKAVLHGQYSANTAGLHGGLVNLESSGSSIKELRLAPGSSTQEHSAGSNGGLLHVGSGASIGFLAFLDHQASNNKAGGEGGMVAVVAGAEVKDILILNSTVGSSQASQGGCISVAAGAKTSSMNITVRPMHDV